MGEDGAETVAHQLWAELGIDPATGSVPLGNTGSAKSHNPDVPTSISDLVDAFRSYEPADRPLDAIEALGLLEMGRADPGHRGHA